MATAELLRQLVKSGSEGDHQSFRRISEELIRDERAKNHHLLANDLEKILYGRRKTDASLHSMLNDKLPKDKERNLPLLQIREPVRSLEEVALSDENSSLLNELLHERHRAEILSGYGLYPVDKLLFCGPPGCGKTLTAEVLAYELGLPLAVVRVDSVISSFLGETASHLQQIFDYASSMPMVVLFDEFDAIAKERSDEAEHGELKRVVNAFLQMLDAYAGKSVLVAATNHDQILDFAVWRRFDEVFVFELPDLSQLRSLIAIKLRGLRRDFDIENAGVIACFEGMSHADVERVIRRAAKEMVLKGQHLLSEQHLLSAIKRENTRKERMRKC